MIKRKEIDYKYLIFMVSPLLMLFLGLLYKSFIIKHYIHAVDPGYAYLFNGLSMALGDFRVFHIDHPGTPLQLIFAFFIRVIHFFSGEEDLVGDVILHSDKYLYIVSYFIIGLNFIGNFFLGTSIYKITERFFESVFLQLSPFIAFNLVSSLRRVSPEPLIVFNISMFIIAMVYVIHNKQKFKHAIIMGLIVGWCIATKINAAFLVIIPIFLFEGIKRKILFISSSIIGFFLFAFPVLLRADKFFSWIKGTTTHNGIYGSGKEEFINIESFLNAMHSIFVKNILWTSLILASLLILTLHFIPRINKNFKKKDNVYFKVLAGLFFAWLFHLFMVGKHFAYRYLIPGLTLTFFTYYIALNTIVFNRVKTKNILLAIPLIIFLVFLLPEYPAYVRSVKAVYERHEDSYEFYEKNIAGKPTIFVPFYNGAPATVFGLYFGAWYSGPGEQEFFYNDKMKEYISHIYHYKNDMNRIEWWREKITANELIEKYDEVYLFIGEGRQNEKEPVLNLFLQTSDSLQITRNYFNPVTNEEFIKISRKL